MVNNTSIRVNIPMQLAIVESSGGIEILSELLQETELNKIYTEVGDYTKIKSGDIIPEIGLKIIDFTSNYITNDVSSKIKYNTGSNVKSVIIRPVDNSNMNYANESLQRALSSLPAIQPDTIQIVLNFILSETPIVTSDYSYNGKLNWTMGINYNMNSSQSVVDRIPIFNTSVTKGLF